MNKTPLNRSETKDEATEHFSSDFEILRTSFAQLRDDVTKLLHDTLGTGKSGAGMIKDHASAAVGDLKDRVSDLKDTGVESVEKFGQKISERPLLSAAIAVGIGFVLAKLISSKR